MQSINRILVNICSKSLVDSKEFYTQLFDFEIAFDSDWFVQLRSKDKSLELGIIDQDNELLPEYYRSKPNGFYITFVVENADEVYKKAKELGITIVKEPEDTPYGQRRLLVKDPNGALLDISSPIPDFKFGS